MDAQTHFLLDYDGGSPRESTRFVACVEVPVNFRVPRFAKTSAYRIVASLVGAMLCSPASAGSAEEPLKVAGSQLIEPIKWTELAGWSADGGPRSIREQSSRCTLLAAPAPMTAGLCRQ
jgi:hypothetical protein